MSTFTVRQQEYVLISRAKRAGPPVSVGDCGSEHGSVLLLHVRTSGCGALEPLTTQDGLQFIRRAQQAQQGGSD
jgi:hypothetical protein